MVITKLIRLVMSIVKKILKLTAVIILCLVILTLIPNLPPYVEYNAYNVTPPVPLKGALGINTLLNNAERLYEGALKGPEAFEVYNGVLYTGLHGGEIVKFVDGNIIPVAKFGLPCEGLWEEKKCGRPLGMKFGRDGFLYVADAYYGLYKVNVGDGTKTQLVSVRNSIENKPIKLPNGVDVAEDGTIYWTVSSSEFNLEDGVFDILADGSGRLLRYNPKTKTNEVLIDNLHFANGVVLSSNEEFVLVAETARSRIHRYYIKGPKKGVHDIFLDGLPGVPDNLKSDGSNGFFVPLVLVRDSRNPIFFQSLGPFPSIRKALSRVLALLELFFGQIDSIYPNYYAKRAIHYVGHFESLHGIGPKRVSILHVDENGKIKSSYHCTDGRLTGISEVQWFNGAFYLGSPYNTYVGRVALEIPELHNHKKLPIKEDSEQAHNQEQPKKQMEQQKQKQPPTEQKPPVQQKYSAQDKKLTDSQAHQQKQFIKEEKVPVKQQKQEKREQIKPVQQQKPPVETEKPTVQQHKEGIKMQKPQVQQQKQYSKESPSLKEQRPPMQQSNENVNKGKQSTRQQKPAAEIPKPAQQQKQQQSAEIPKPAQQQKQSAEVPKPAQQQSAKIPKPPAQQLKQQQSAEVPKLPAQKQSAEIPKPVAQKQSAEISKSAAQQQKQSAEVPKSPAQQQKQQQSAEIPKSPAKQQKQSAEVPKSPSRQQKQSAEIPKPPEQQQKQQQKKLEAKQEKQPVNEQKTVPQHHKSQVKDVKPQVQQQQKPVKEETIPAQQKHQPMKNKPAAQQQMLQPQEEKSQNQQEPVKVQNTPVVPSVSQGKKPSMQQEKLSRQQQQPSETSHQKPTQDKIPTKEQHPPK